MRHRKSKEKKKAFADFLHSISAEDMQGIENFIVANPIAAMPESDHYHILREALITQNKDIVHRLVDHGIIIDARDGHKTCLTMAAMWRKSALKYNATRFLLELGANPNLYYDSPALHFSVFADNIETARELIEYGADINAKDWKGKTAYELAMYVEGYKMAEFLKDVSTNRLAK